MVAKGDIFPVDEYIGDGIVVPKQFIYLGDGVYAEYRPEIQYPEEGENSNPDNNVRGEREEDDTGYLNELNNAGSIY